MPSGQFAVDRAGTGETDENLLELAVRVLAANRPRRGVEDVIDTLDFEGDLLGKRLQRNQLTTIIAVRLKFQFLDSCHNH